LKRYALPVYFGTLHGINDAMAGFLLAQYSLAEVSNGHIVLAFLGYSLIAFGGQLPVGWLLDKIQNTGLLVRISLFLLMACCLTAWISLPAAIILSGGASALVHVCGGTICYLYNTRSPVAAGIFTAPGVLGLILGGLAGQAGSVQWFLFFLPVLVLLFILLMRFKLPEYTMLDKPEQQPILETHDYIMLVLLLAIALRSMIWNILYVLAEQQDIRWLLGIGIAAFAGKLFGAYMAGKADWKKYVFISVGISAMLLTLGKESLVFFCFGIFLLQSAVPITLWLMQQYLNRQPATATALSLGTAIILAGLPAYLDEFRNIQWDKSLLTATFVLLLLLNGFWLLNTKRRPAKPS
jgi:MFS transporter, FSR family, fosmidomycin resistance protein